MPHPQLSISIPDTLIGAIQEEKEVEPFALLSSDKTTMALPAAEGEIRRLFEIIPLTANLLALQFGFNISGFDEHMSVIHNAGLKIMIMDMTTGEIIKEHILPEGEISEIVAISENEYATVSVVGIKFWDIKTFAMTHHFPFTADSGDPESLMYQSFHSVKFSVENFYLIVLESFKDDFTLWGINTIDKSVYKKPAQLKRADWTGGDFVMENNYALPGAEENYNIHPFPFNDTYLAKTLTGLTPIPGAGWQPTKSINLPNHKLLALHNMGKISLSRQQDDGSFVRVKEILNVKVLSKTLLPYEHIVYCDDDNKVHMLNVDDFSCHELFNIEQNGKLQALAVMPDGRIITLAIGTNQLKDAHQLKSWFNDKVLAIIRASIFSALDKDFDSKELKLEKTAYDIMLRDLSDIVTSYYAPAGFFKKAKMPISTELDECKSSGPSSATLESHESAPSLPLTPR